MSRSRARRHGWKRPDNGYSTSTPSEKGVQRILARGCGGYQDYWGEFECRHNYRWECGDCPIVGEVEKTVSEPQTLQLVKTIPHD